MNNPYLLRPMFSYSMIPILTTSLLIGLIIFFLLRKKKEKKEENIPIIIKPEVRNLFRIKDKYREELNQLQISLQNNKIQTRKAYQKLSVIIRNFIYEVTQIKVQNYSLEEIKKVNIPELTSLVEEYYEPEFAKDSKGFIETSLQKTREVIEKWH